MLQGTPRYHSELFNNFIQATQLCLRLYQSPTTTPKRLTRITRTNYHCASCIKFTHITMPSNLTHHPQPLPPISHAHHPVSPRSPPLHTRTADHAPYPTAPRADLTNLTDLLALGGGYVGEEVGSSRESGKRSETGEEMGRGGDSGYSSW